MVTIHFLLKFSLLEQFIYHLTIVNVDNVHVEPVDSSMTSNILVDFVPNDVVSENMHVVDVDDLNIAPLKSARPPKSNKT